jgi:hypothetical protein
MSSSMMHSTTRRDESRCRLHGELGRPCLDSSTIGMPPRKHHVPWPLACALRAPHAVSMYLQPVTCAGGNDDADQDECGGCF